MSKTRNRRSRPCSICHRWFTPNPRVRNSQRTCGREECKREQKRRTQAKWSRRNPDYWTARRLVEKLDRVESGEEVAEFRGPPREMRRIPADVAQDAIGAKLVVILDYFARVLSEATQDAIRRQLLVIRADFGTQPRPPPQDAISDGL